MRSPAEAVRWACLVEATSPKVGNVFPGRPFVDLSYEDFVAAAEIASTHFAACEQFSLAIKRSVEETVQRCKTNVNLGILLLLGPLVAADHRLQHQEIDHPCDEDWLVEIGHVLQGLSVEDHRLIFEAIGLSSAGGLGKADRWDVNDSYDQVNLIEAMADSAARDRIAMQYATDFGDLFSSILPIVAESIEACGDLMRGVVSAHIKLLAGFPDSLIARKNGNEVASEVQKLASQVDVDNPEQVKEFDTFLRDDGHRLNPGTTADLIAASLYVLFRGLPAARCMSTRKGVKG
ncbi:triphosphoribosyl-dephospho-CoA synthase [bacterium]|nr:triphosphoribosyl-dephospho-CoA synthase [bacterium]